MQAPSCVPAFNRDGIGPSLSQCLPFYLVNNAHALQNGCVRRGVAVVGIVGGGVTFRF